jgi:hypothetical protein
MALEMGLHRKETLFTVFPDPEKRSLVVRLFWCIYVLDRRGSFGTSLPFAVQDADIDPGLPEPVSHRKNALLPLNLTLSGSRLRIFALSCRLWPLILESMACLPLLWDSLHTYV